MTAGEELHIREQLEKQEHERLSRYAQLASASAGRKVKEEESVLRTCYQRDKDRILHSLYFRLLKYKTNVFLSTSGEKFRTRLTHTLEVSQIARTICRALNLNEDLAEAISLGHDLGHTPFGHTGEEVLNKLSPTGFHHAQQSLRVVDKLEKNGKGLNLTSEVRDGIVKHSKGTKTLHEVHDKVIEYQDVATLEGVVVQYSDWIAYINHDIDDAIEMGLITMDSLPKEAVEVLGVTHGKRVNTMVLDIVGNSRDSAKLKMSKTVLEATEILRAFMYREVYKLPSVKNRMDKAYTIIAFLYKYYMDNTDYALKEYPWLANELPYRITTDIISSMTDTTAQAVYRKLIR
ncbi:MAG: deoxyguanosinetriphosphate triphosphohydrolase [Elusimicrobiota bacterium]